MHNQDAEELELQEQFFSPDHLHSLHSSDFYVKGTQNPESYKNSSTSALKLLYHNFGKLGMKHMDTRDFRRQKIIELGALIGCMGRMKEVSVVPDFPPGNLGMK